MILSWAWFVVAAVILVDLAVQGRDHTAVVTAAAVLVVTGIVYACAYRPKIVADPFGISLINPVRDHRVPWAAVVKVDVVNAVRVHCTPAPGAAHGKVLYSWAVQASPRSARRAAMRSQAASHPRGRLIPRSRSMQPPPGTPPPGAPRYGEMPQSAQEALDRSTADFTAARLSERAQHAQAAAARAAAARLPADQEAVQPGEPGADQAVAVAADPRAEGDSPAAAAEQATAQWAWLPIAAMVVPLLLLLLMALV